MCQDIAKVPPYGKVVYIGPTNQHAKDIMWEEIEKRLNELKWKNKPLISKSHFAMAGNRKLYIIGAEKIDRVRGHGLHSVYFDEIAFFNKNLRKIWEAIRPALTESKGRATMATTPNGKGTQAYDWYLDIKSKANWAYHHWRTIDNPYLDPTEIEQAKLDLDEKSFNQEYLAEWESFEGLAYYNFEEDTHIERCDELYFDTDELCIMQDFNVNPTSLLVGQKVGKEVFFRKEYSIKNSSTEMTIKNFCEDFKSHKDYFRIMIHGDSTGNNRNSVTGRSDYWMTQDILTQYGFEWKMQVRSKNPSPIDRVSAVNSYLKNYYGQSRVTIDPSCKDLIRDFGSQELEGRYPSDKNNLGHKADAAGYFIHWHWLKERAKPSSVQQL